MTDHRLPLIIALVKNAMTPQMAYLLTIKELTPDAFQRMSKGIEEQCRKDIETQFDGTASAIFSDSLTDLVASISMMVMRCTVLDLNVLDLLLAVENMVQPAMDMHEREKKKSAS